MCIYALCSVAGIIRSGRFAGILVGIFRPGIRLVGQCNVQNLIDPLDRADLQRFLDVVRYLLEIPDIFIRDNNSLDTAPMGLEAAFPSSHQLPEPDLAG